MKNNDLMQKLASELNPVKSLPSPLHMTASFSLIGMGLIAVSFFLMSARIDLKEQLLNPRFVLELSVSLILALVALMWAFYLSRPGQKPETQKYQRATLGFLALMFFFDGFRIFQLNPNQIQLGLSFAGIGCLISILGYSLILGTVLIYWLRKGASTTPRKSGLATGVACVALGNVSIAFFCGVDNGLHILLWHLVLPMCAGLSGAILAGRLFLKW